MDGAQEGTLLTQGHHDETACASVGALLARVSDKWTVLVIRTLGPGPLRFNALRRTMGEISQKMLAQTLRDLEENGFVTRTVTPTSPPQVEYALTALGRDLLVPMGALADWAIANSAQMAAARARYAAAKDKQG
jgi:DNA-binding HxlR family transcriptional regulator